MPRLLGEHALTEFCGAHLTPSVLNFRAVHVCAALGPHHAAITALEAKVEAVRTAMTASVKLMIQELASVVEAAGESGSIRVAMGADVGAGVLAIKVGRQLLKQCWGCHLISVLGTWRVAGMSRDTIQVLTGRSSALLDNHHKACLYSDPAALLALRLPLRLTSYGACHQRVSCPHLSYTQAVADEAARAVAASHDEAMLVSCCFFIERLGL